VFGDVVKHPRHFVGLLIKIRLAHEGQV
jgi:hypothetical protein